MTTRMKVLAVFLVLGMCAATAPAMAFMQYPNDICYTATGAPCPVPPGPPQPFPAGSTVLVDWNNNGNNDVVNPNAHLIARGATDGFVKMPDGKPLYMFGFMDLAGVPQNLWSDAGMNKSEFPAPTIDIREGEDVYLLLANLDLANRPDLFDAHTLHFHGFINASAVFDGEPMSGIAPTMHSDLTYYYAPKDPGTYMYHCHVEATEHIEMGMVGNLLIRPLQDGQNIGGFTKFVYNDNLIPGAGGTTGYDVEKIIMLADIDPTFHDLHIGVQPLPFALLDPKYFTMNGRGYPDTVNPAPLLNNGVDLGAVSGENYFAQKLDSLITATVGQRLLIRLANLSVQNLVNVEILGLPMKVVGKDAKFLRKANGIDQTYFTNSVNVGAGESFDLLIDTAGVVPGTYYLYARNLTYLNNDQMDRGGAMTEIRISLPLPL